MQPPFNKTSNQFRQVDQRSIITSGMQAATPDVHMGQITPELRLKNKQTTDDGRSKSPPRPSILLKDSFQLSRDQFNQSVHFGNRHHDEIEDTAAPEESTEELRKKFMSTSAVDFNNQIVRMSENDRVLVASLQKRLNEQRQALQNKSKIFEAIQKNVVILEAMTDHQRKELNLLGRQNNKLKSKYQENLESLTRLQDQQIEMNKELKYLRDKNQAFAEADADRAGMIQKLDGLEREIDRQKAQLEEQDFQIKVLQKENTQIKDDMLNADQNLMDSKKEQKRLTDENNRLEVEVLKYQAKSDQDDLQISKLKEEVDQLKKQVKLADMENQDLKNKGLIFRRQINEKDDQIEELVENVNNQLQTIDSQERKLVERANIEEGLRKRLQSLTDELNSEKDAYAKRSSMWEQDLIYQKEKLDKLEKEMGEAKTKCKKTETDLNSIISALEEEKKQVERSLSSVTNELKEQTVECTELKIENHKMKSKQREIVDEMRQEFEYQIQDQASQIEILTDEKKTLEEDTKEIRENFDSIKSQIAEKDTAISRLTDSLTQTQMELNSRSTLAEELQIHADQATEQLENMKKNLDGLVENAVEEKEAQFLRVEQQLGETQTKLKTTLESLDEYKKDKVKKNDLLAKEKKKVQDYKRDIDFLKHRLDNVEKEAKRKKKEETERMQETEKLHRENEQYKSEMAYIYQNYDLDTLDEKIRSAKKTEEWAEQFMSELSQLFNVLESFMTCTLCNHTIKDKPNDKPVLILPCQHVFCGSCHAAKRAGIGNCKNCGKAEASVIENLFVGDLAQKYEQFKDPLVKKIKWMKARIDKNFSV